MSQEIFHEFWTDSNGNPAGGISCGKGFTISWQNGKLVDDEGQRKEPNGVFVDTIIRAAVDRLEYYQTTKFVCMENAEAIKDLRDALAHLTNRISRRVAEGTEGTHKIPS